MPEAIVTLRFHRDASDVLQTIRKCEDFFAAFDILQARFDSGYVARADGWITAIHPLDVIPRSIHSIHPNPEDVDAIDVVGVFDI